MTRNQVMQMMAGVELSMMTMGASAAPSFLFARERVIHLAPLESPMQPGYVWRKVFLKGKRPV